MVKIFSYLSYYLYSVKKRIVKTLLLLYVLSMCYEKDALNVLKTKLKPCSMDPLTGFYRDGHCKTYNNDIGEHIICSEMTIGFLNFSKSMGNDLITAVPEYNFSGLKAGDRWCLCADRWIEALNHNIAPKIVLESTHIKMLNKIGFNTLKKFGVEFMNLN